MYKLDLTHMTEEDLNTVKDYLNSDRVSIFMFEHFIDTCLRRAFDNNINDDSFLEVIELSIIYNQIVELNYLIIYKTVSNDINNNIKDTILNSIKEELTTRFYQNLQNTLIKKTQTIDKKLKL